MSRILSQENGITTYFEYDPETDKSYLRAEQDTGLIVDTITHKRNENRWAKEVKEDFVHFATIPHIVELDLLARGINIHDKNCTKKMMQVIQSEYPYLLAHAGKKLA